MKYLNLQNRGLNTWFSRIFMVIIVCILFFPTPSVFCQNVDNNRSLVGVLGIDSKGFPSIDPLQMAQIVRTELDKLNKFEVMDKYDIEYLLKNADAKPDNCFGKVCLVEMGKKIRADKMLSGSIELNGERIFMNFRFIDVASASVEKSKTIEFLNLRSQIPLMVGLTLQKMFDQTVDNELLTKLTKKFDYENAINNPDQERLNLSGPRMGFTLFTGATADILKAKTNIGGFDVNPYMFQFGYQFEVQYLNQGNFQALFEIVPLITGVDQGKFFPSISILNGLRSNIGGFELAFGPVFYMTNRAKGYIDDSNKWHIGDAPNPNFPTETRMDSRGNPTFDTGFVFALGKSFKSGKLNIPFNIFAIPRRDGVRCGISMGFNAKR